MKLILICTNNRIISINQRRMLSIESNQVYVRKYIKINMKT